MKAKSIKYRMEPRRKWWKVLCTNSIVTKGLFFPDPQLFSAMENHGMTPHPLVWVSFFFHNYKKTCSSSLLFDDMTLFYKMDRKLDQFWRNKSKKKLSSFSRWFVTTSYLASKGRWTSLIFSQIALQYVICT